MENACVKSSRRTVFTATPKNPFEYDAIIQEKVKPTHADNPKSRSKWFDFHKDSNLAARWAQTLCAKQKTMIFKGKAPKFPGKPPPIGHVTYNNWLKRANRYAEYVLTMFRPCAVFDGHHQPLCITQDDYGWYALQTWIEQLQQDDTVLSKFRLMAIDRRMNSLVTDFGTKKILSHYRARAADKWTKHQKHQYQLERSPIASFEAQHNELLLDDELFEQQHSRLSAKSTKVAKQVNTDANAFKASIMKCSTIRRTENNGYNTWTVPTDEATNVLCSDEEASTWYDKCEWIYRDGKEDDGSPYNESIDDKSLSSSNHDGSYEESDDEQEDGMFHLPTQLNKEQKQVVDLYKEYLLSPTSTPSSKSPPSVVLLTGKGGTGKSFVIHKLLALVNGNSDGVVKVWTAANNNLNACDIDGSTIASLLKQTIEPSKDETLKRKTRPQKRICQSAIAALQNRNIKDLLLLIIDEISNITAQKLGELSQLFQMATGVHDKSFGGILVLLVGDYYQKEPIGELATTSVLKYVHNKHKLEVIPPTCCNDGDIPRPKQKKKQRHLKKLQSAKCTKRLPKDDTVFTNTKYNGASDHVTGCQIITNA